MKIREQVANPFEHNASLGEGRKQLVFVRYSQDVQCGGTCVFQLSLGTAFNENILHIRSWLT